MVRRSRHRSISWNFPAARRRGLPAEVHPATHIKGTTRLYGLVGDPLTTAKSTELLNRLFIEQRADAICVPFRVKADDLSAFVNGARAMGNLSGVLVTMPHKQRMLAFVDELHPTAGQVGALNVIRCHDDGRWVGAIFDGLGCVLGMQWEAITRRTSPFFSSALAAQAELSHLRSHPRVPKHLPFSMSTSVALTTSPSRSPPQPAAVHALAHPIHTGTRSLSMPRR